MNVSTSQKANQNQNPTERVHIRLHTGNRGRQSERTGYRVSCTSAGAGAFSLGLVTTLALLFICGSQKTERRLKALAAKAPPVACPRGDTDTRINNVAPSARP